MNPLYLLRALFAFSILAFSGVTVAEGEFTSDPESGLDWLNLSATAGMVYNDAPSAFPGWRHATNAEVVELFENEFPGFVAETTQGVATSPPIGTGYPNLRDQAKSFITSYGPSFSDTEHVWAVGVYRDEHDALKLMGALDNDGFEYSQVLGIDYTQVVIGANPRYGIFLVRGSGSGDLRVQHETHIGDKLSSFLFVLGIKPADNLTVQSMDESIVLLTDNCFGNDQTPFGLLLIPVTETFAQFCIHGVSLGSTSLLIDNSDGRSLEYPITVEPINVRIDMDPDFLPYEPARTARIEVSHEHHRVEPSADFVSPLAVDGDLNYELKVENSKVLKVSELSSKRSKWKFAGTIEAHSRAKAEFEVHAQDVGTTTIRANAWANHRSSLVTSQKQITVSDIDLPYAKLLEAIEVELPHGRDRGRLRKFVRDSSRAYIKSDYESALIAMSVFQLEIADLANTGVLSDVGFARLTQSSNSIIFTLEDLIQ